MASFIAIKDRTGEFKHYKVPEEIAIYIKQLEIAVLHPYKSKLKELYPERFHV